MPTLRDFSVLRSAMFSFLLAAALGPASGNAAVIYVGDPLQGCEANSLGGALFAAFGTPESDTIRLTEPLTDVQEDFTNWDPATFGAVEIVGGFDSCGGSQVANSRTTVSGNALGPVFDISATGASQSAITLRSLVVQGAVDYRGVEVDGAGASVALVDVVIRQNSGGLSVINGANASLDEQTTLFNNNAGFVAGGGILCMGGTITSEATVQVNHTDGVGGGASLTSGCTLTLLDRSWFLGNTAQVGGGLAISGGSMLQLATGDGSGRLGVEIRDNVATIEGGGLWVDDGTVDLVGSAIAGNAAAERGGGLYAEGTGTVVTMERGSGPCANPAACSSIDGNSLSNPAGPKEGAAFYVAGGADVTLYQTTIDDNETIDRNGFALFATGDQTSVLLEGVSYANNSTESLFEARDQADFVVAFSSAAANSFGPLLTPTASSGGGVSDLAFLLVASSILWDHTGFQRNNANVLLDCSMVQTDVGSSVALTTTVGTDPLFLNPGDGDLRTSPDSAAVDYCDDLNYSPTRADLRNQPRGWDTPSVVDFLGPFDLGAHELFGLLFADGFELGDLARWTSSSP